MVKTCPTTNLSWTKIRLSTVQRTGPRKKPTGVSLVKGQLYLQKDKQKLQDFGPSERTTIRIASNARYLCELDTIQQFFVQIWHETTYASSGNHIYYCIMSASPTVHLHLMFEIPRLKNPVRQTQLEMDRTLSPTSRA